MSNAIAVDITKIPSPVMNAHCRTLLNCIGKFFDDPQNQRDFEEWHIKQYGCPPKETSYRKEDQA